MRCDEISKKPWHEMTWDEMTWDDDTQLAMRWDGSCELHNIMCNSCSRQDWTHMYTLYHSWHIEDTLRFLITCLQERCLIVVYCHMVPVFCTMTVSHIRIFLNKFADLIVHLQARHHCNVYNLHAYNKSNSRYAHFFFTLVISVEANMTFGE